MTPIKPGTARRFGLRRSTYVTLAEIDGSPHGVLRAVVSSRCLRSFVVNAKGSAVHDTGTIIRAGQIRDTRDAWTGRWQDIPEYQG